MSYRYYLPMPSLTHCSCQPRHCCAARQAGHKHMPCPSASHQKALSTNPSCPCSSGLPPTSSSKPKGSKNPPYQQSCRHPASCTLHPASVTHPPTCLVQRVAQRVRWVGGDHQRRVACLGEAHRQGRGQGGLAHTALAADHDILAASPRRQLLKSRDVGGSCASCAHG